MLIRALFFAAIVKVLLTTDRPFLCAGLYALAILAMNFLSVLTGQATWLQLAAATGIALAVSSVIFVLLSKTEGGLWWLVLILGTAAVTWL